MEEQEVQGRSGMRGRLEMPACLDPGFSNGNDPSSRSGQAAGDDRQTRDGERRHDSVSELIVRVEQIDRAEKHSAAALARGLLSTAARGQGFGPDPFQPYNSQYAPFVYPVAPGPMDYGYNNGLARGVRGANQFENYLNSLQTSAAGGEREPRARAHPIFRPIGLTTVSSAASTSPTSWRTSNSRPTRQVSTSCTSSTCGRKTPRNAPRSSAIIAARSRADRVLASPRGVPGAQPGTRSTRREGLRRKVRGRNGSEGPRSPGRTAARGL